MPDSIVLTFPRLPIPQVRGNGVSRQHYRETRKHQQWEKEQFYLMAREAREAIGAPESDDLPWGRVIVHIDYYNASEIDYDNMLTGFKPVLDVLGSPVKDGEVLKLGFIVDDKPSVIKELTMRYHKCKRNEARSVVTITREME